MKRALFRCHGDPAQVLEVVTEPDPVPGPGQVRVRLKVMTINPADLLSIEGRYGAEPLALPTTPGVGGWGIVDAVGDGVKRLAVGDAVLPLGPGQWADTLIVHERMAPKAPPGADPEQAALMRANPATAELMLSDLVALKPGDWVVQNAANSAVGRLVIRFARETSYRTVNIVRRADVVDSLRAEGADAVIVDDGADLTAAILAATGGIPPRLALDAIGGRATAALAAAVATGGTVAVYGLLSGQPPQVEARDLVFRDVHIRGFWLAAWYAAAEPEAIRDLHAGLAERLARGETHQAVEARYPLDRVRDAVAHAARPGRNGKIMLTAG
jgi:NADPH:quinone reductase-like Zn-dependent oxidoreductase